MYEHPLEPSPDPTFADWFRGKRLDRLIDRHPDVGAGEGVGGSGEDGYRPCPGRLGSCHAARVRDEGRVAHDLAADRATKFFPVVIAISLFKKFNSPRRNTFSLHFVVTNELDYSFISAFVLV